MTVEEVRAKINEIISGSFSAQVYLVLKTDDRFELRLADIADATEPDLRNLFSESVQAQISNNDALSICNLSDADEETPKNFV